MKFPRRSGIVLHPTALPGRFGIGDLGDAALRLVDFLQAAGQTYWQILPLNPTGYGDSPYLCFSALAGNPLLISPEKLVAQGYLAESDIANVPTFPVEKVDYGWVIQFKTDWLNRAFTNFQAGASADQEKAFRRFCKTQAAWLDDYALFMALKESRGWRPWHEWERELVIREERAMARARKELAAQIENQKYRQWQFFEQWLSVKEYANERGVKIIGDIPIFVALDSAEVWANPDVFYLDKNFKPVVVTGVPPDFFSATGQLWGHPHYRWNLMAEDNFAWWIERFKMALTVADVVRIDHFRGFYNYWQVPYGETTAVKGKWVKGPGAKLFRAVTQALGEVAIIAEDLGDFDKESRAGVTALQKEFGYPGMKVLNFAFDGKSPHNPFLPHNFSGDEVVYTSTHDSNTVVGWYHDEATERVRDHVRRYLARDGSDVAWDFIRLAWSSVSPTAMTTAQDLLSLDGSARMNAPGTASGNWQWRMLPGALNDAVAARLKELTELYGRVEK
jgi:4-alpha-glucanotransferase